MMEKYQLSPEDVRKLDEERQQFAAMRDLKESAKQWKANYEGDQRNKRKLVEIQKVSSHNPILNLNSLF